MFFFLCILLLAVTTACLPLIIKYLSPYFPDITVYKGNVWLPIIAGIFMVVSTQLPNVHISNQTSTFQQHFMGGGMYSACLYLYAKQIFKWRLRKFIDLLALFSWVSAFGVANKLFEFALLELNLANIYTGDAYWDLLANTLGGFFAYLLLFKFV